MTENPDNPKPADTKLVNTKPIGEPDLSASSTPSALDAIAHAADQAASAPRSGGGIRGPAPVHLWDPPYCGDIGLEIRVDGSWWYKGSIIGRPAMVGLFASVLRKDADGQTYLVTPVEKILVQVADAPFLGVDLTAAGCGESQTLTLSTNLGDSVVIGTKHPLRFELEAGTGGLKPYVLIRGRLEARLTRAMTHELMQVALSASGAVASLESGQSALGAWSGGIFWPVPG
ncbi:MAG: DUF1285 domain-containing protein [Hyphomicrobium aestuarii]|nr:DUF1285 domain-containing protein [Hyphomicrobium aestuarii]